MRVRRDVRDESAYERRWTDVPRRAFLPVEEQEPAVAVRLERLAATPVLDDPEDRGGEPQLHLEYADGTREPFHQWVGYRVSQGLEFGYLGSGPRALALNVLGLVLPLREAGRLCQRFKETVIARVPREGGRLLMGRDVIAWVEAVWAEERADPARMAEEEEMARLQGEMESDEGTSADDSAGDDVVRAGVGDGQAGVPGAARARAAQGEARRDTAVRAALAQLPAVGAVVTTVVPTMGNAAGEVAVAIEHYRFANHVGVTLLFPNGAECGWGIDELDTLGPTLGHIAALRGFTYESSAQVDRLFAAGYFRDAFREARALRDRAMGVRQDDAGHA